MNDNIGEGDVIIDTNDNKLPRLNFNSQGPCETGKLNHDQL